MKKNLDKTSHTCDNIYEKKNIYTTTVLNTEVAEKLKTYCNKYGLSKSSMIRLLINLGVDTDILSNNAYTHIQKRSGEDHE